MIVINILLIMLLGIIFLFKNKIKEINIDFIKHYKPLVIILFSIILITSFYNLSVTPTSIHIDEAGMAYDALSLSTDGVDRYLNKNPIYFINFGGGQSVMMGYLVSFLLNIFEFSLFIVRTPGVILKIILMICGFFFLKDKKQRLLFLFILTINPYFMMQSRFGLDCNLMVGFLTIASFLLHNSIIKNKSLILPGIFFGLTLYTYALSFITVPIYLAIVCSYLLYIKKISIKKLIIFGIPIFLLAMPLILMILVNSGVIPEINSFITIPEMTSYRGSEISLNNIFINLYILLSIVSFDMPFVFGDLLNYNASLEFGTIYFIGIPFFLVGIISVFKDVKKSIKLKEYNLNLLISCWFTASLICQLLIVQPNINKANAIMFPVVYFVFLGIYKAFLKHKNIIVPVIVLFSFNFILFLSFYFNNHTTANNGYDLFYTDFNNALEYSLSLEEDLFYVEGRAIYSNLYLQTNPYKYSEYKVVGEKQTHIYDLSIIDKEAGYIVHKDSEINLKLSDYKYKEIFGKYIVYYN